ncbi:MAG: PIN domain-containing protein [Bdellovibrionota bacterium]
MLNLDTHILIYALAGTLSKKEKLILENSLWCISGIVLWELTKLSQLGKVKIDLDSRKVKSLLSNIEVLPINLQVCRALNKLDFKSDPADEIIAATSIANKIPLLTRDKLIKTSKVLMLV